MNCSFKQTAITENALRAYSNNETYYWFGFSFKFSEMTIDNYSIKNYEEGANIALAVSLSSTKSLLKSTKQAIEMY